MNDVLKAIRERRSIRSFSPELPSRDALEAIIEAGLFAASGKGQQSAVIAAITNPALRERLRMMNCRIGGWREDFDPFYGAPVLLLVLADRSNPNHVYDGSLVMGNLMLAAHSLGLGSIWINRARQEFDSDEGREILRELGIEGDWEGIAHCAVGYIHGSVPPAAPRRESRVFWAE